jgi:hypothetical protein
MWKDRTMTLFILKIIAIITMTTDHAASAFFDNMMVMRVIGRIAFLLYAFMIAEGFYHIKDKPDRIKAHLIKLGMLCVISEFAYDFMEEGKLIDWSSQSVMPVLFLGFIGLIITERFAKKPWIIVLYYIASALVNYYAKFNYKFVGVLLIYGFYFYIKYAKNMSFWKKLLILIPSITLYFCLYTWARVSFGGFQAWLESFMKYYPWLFGHYAAMIIIASYNGKLGPRNKVFNGLYSVYYPLHMAVIGLIAML